jgi:UDP-glucose 4-epimerase
MRVLVTGGAGFIGTTVVQDLVKAGHGVRILDNMSSPDAPSNIEVLDGMAEIVHGDVTDASALDGAMVGCDAVVHLAAKLEITKSQADPVSDLWVNLVGTIKVIEACKRAGIRRLVNASSACVYGQTDGTPSSEGDATDPNWEYGASKLAAEKYAKIANDSGALDITSLRFSIVFGENEWYGRVLPIFVKRALLGKPLVVFGSGSQTRDYVHVKDVSRFIVEFCLGESENTTYGEVYNVSSGRGISVNTLAALVNDTSPGSSGEVVYDSVEEGGVSELVAGRVRLSEELEHLVLDNGKARSLGWAPLYSLERDIVEYVNWAWTRTSTRWNTVFKV